MAAVLEKDAAPKQSSIADLRRVPANEQGGPLVRMGFDTSQGFDLMQRGARLLAASSLVPKEYQGNLPNCVIALNMASRIGADPLLVMQNLYVVHGRPGWSSKFLIASFNQCGRFSAIRFEWVSERGSDEWGCRAWAIEKDTQQRIQGPWITIALAKKEGWVDKNGSKWKTIPELMLMYRSAGWLVNTHAPEISMGLNTTEEIGDVYDAEQDGAGGYTVTQDDLRRVDKDTGVLEPTGVSASNTAGSTPPVGATGGDGGAPTVTRATLAGQIAAAKSTDDLDGLLDLMSSSALSAGDQDFIRDEVKKKRAALEK